MITFVYVQGLRGPEPQKWAEKLVSASGKSPAPLQAIELPDDYAALPIAQLTTLYPYTGAPDVT